MRKSDSLLQDDRAVGRFDDKMRVAPRILNTQLYRLGTFKHGVRRLYADVWLFLFTLIGSLEKL